MESPDTAVERARTSDRLDSIDRRLERLEEVERGNGELLRRLVELGEARDRREVDQVAWERQRDADRANWWARLLDSKAADRIVTALVTALGTVGTAAAVYYGGGYADPPAAVTVRPPVPIHAPMPSSSGWGSVPGPKDGVE